jgi:hypothetical protein
MKGGLKLIKILYKVARRVGFSTMNSNERVVRTIPTADGNAAVVTDCLPFRQSYQKWRDMAASIGCEDIGLRCRGPSMLDWIETQGEPYGPSGRAPRKRSEMRFEGIRILDRLCLKSVFDREDRRDLEGLLNTLKYQKLQQEFNPANIEFIVPVHNSYNKRANDWIWQKVYGHYRTKNYEQALYGDGAVDTSWYTSERMRGAAKPPVWQALFGDGTVEPFRTRGLLHVVLEGMRLLNEGIEITIPSVRISGLESSEKAYRIGCLRRAVERLTAQGRYTTKAGRFSTTAACRELSRRKFSASTVVESEIVKELAGIGGLEGDVVEFRVSISRRQMQKLAGMAGWKGSGEQGHDPVADFIEARWRKRLGEFNRRSELQSRLSRIIGRTRAKELIDEVEIGMTDKKWEANKSKISEWLKVNVMPKYDVSFINYAFAEGDANPDMRKNWWGTVCSAFRDVKNSPIVKGQRPTLPGWGRALLLSDLESMIISREVDLFQLHRMFLTNGQIMVDSNYRDNRSYGFTYSFRGVYPMFLPFGNIIRQMYHESAITATGQAITATVLWSESEGRVILEARPCTLRAGIIPSQKLPSSRRCGICNRKGHNRRTCEQAKTGNRDVCPDCPLEKCYCKN